MLSHLELYPWETQHVRTWFGTASLPIHLRKAEPSRREERVLCHAH